MRKSANICITVLIIAVLFLLLLFWPHTAAPVTSSTALKEAASGLDDISYDLVFSPEQNTLAVTMEWHYTNRDSTPLDDIVLRLYPKAFEQESTSPAAQEDIRAECYPNGFSAASVALHDLYWNNAAVSCSFDAKDTTVLRVRIPALSSKERGTLRLRCVLSIPDCRYLFGRSDHVWMLGHCLPFIAARSDGNWQTAPYPMIGDPLGPPLANCRLALTLPKGYTCAAPFPWQETTAGSLTRLQGEILSARDIALSISDRFQQAQKTTDGTLIRSYAGNIRDAKKALAFAEKALRFYTNEYGAYPYPVYTVAAVPLPFDGAGSTAFFMIAPARYQDDSRLELTVSSGTAHQWFGILVGSDPLLNAWQDEAVCEYALLQYVRAAHGEDARDRLAFLRADAPMRESIRREITVGSPVDRFQSHDEYRTVVYGRGLSMLLSLQQNMDVNAFLKRYVEAFSWRSASREDFVQALCDAAGWDARPLMTDFLDTAI